jgi:hypothetical protein
MASKIYFRFYLTTFLHRVSQKWRTNYLLPYRGCLNMYMYVHEKNVSDKKNQLFLLLLLLTVIQCKQDYLEMLP